MKTGWRSAALPAVLLVPCFTFAQSEATRTAVANGSRLTAEGAARLERALLSHPQDLQKRAELLGYYSSLHQRLEASAELKQKRRSSIEWLADNAPDSDIWLLRAASIEKTGDALADPEGYAAIQSKWLDLIKLHARNASFLGHAGRFLMMGDRDKAKQFLVSAQQLEPGQSDWAFQLGVLDGLSILDVSGLNAYDLPVEATLPLTSTKQAFEALEEVKRSSSPVWVCAAAMAVLRYGSVFVTQDNPKRDVSNLAAVLVQRGLQLSDDDPICRRALQRVAIWRKMRADNWLPSAQLAVRSKVLVAEELAQEWIVSTIAPAYPNDARSRGIEGAVVLEALAGEDGGVREVKPITGAPELAAAAMASVRKWRFEPLVLNGHATQMVTDVKIEFKLGR